MAINSLAGDIQAFQRLYDTRKARRDLYLEQKASAEKTLSDLKEKVDLGEKEQALLLKTAMGVRKQAKAYVERSMTQALQAVFGPDLSFVANIEQSHKRVEADFFVNTKRGNINIQAPPEEGKGGGVVDVVSMGLRLNTLEMSNPPIDGPLIMDEPGKNASEEYGPRVAEFIRECSHGTGRQMILVTHEKDIATIGDKGFRVRLNGDESIVEEIK